MSRLGWVTAFLDTAEERADSAEVFWSRVTGHVVSPRRGRREEFATLLPPDGDAYLRVQRVVQSPPGGLHLDLHADEVEAVASRAEDLGATASYLEEGYVVCGSPGGMTFCVVGDPGERRPSPAAWPSGRSQVDQVCLDVPPSSWQAEVEFWAALTGWEAQPQRREFCRLQVPDTQPLRVLLQQLDEEQPCVTGHLDLACDDVDAEAVRHIALGARQVRSTEGWITLLDPSARPYCLTRRRLPESD